MSTSEKLKICQNCKKEFRIEPEDFAFYEKIKVPPPTWCPQCRMARRLSFRNERALSSRDCDLCKKHVISMYSPEVLFPVYCPDCWWSDKWDALDYGREYDLSQPFFEQLKELLDRVPRPSFLGVMNVNSPYANFVYKSKNIYLSFSILESEDILYSCAADYSTFCMDSSRVTHSELCYESMNIEKCYHSSFLIRCRNCIDSSFLYNCVNCRNCFLSSNLRNKEYVFKNQQLSRDEYFQKIKAYQGSYQGIERAKREFKELVKNSLHRFAYIIKSVNSTGDNIVNSKNTRYSFDVYDMEDVAYALRSLSEKDSMDVFGAGPWSHHSYECLSTGAPGSMQKFCMYTWENVYSLGYSAHCSSASNLFGCVGVRSKNYCILNKQYTKEDYERVVPKIVTHMNEMPYPDEKGRVYKYGEFFPIEFSPFAYNESIAQDHYPLTKEEALKQGYSWEEPEKRTYSITLQSEDLPDHISNVTDSILNETIGCAHEGKCKEQCTTAFKIIPQELAFYRQMNLSLPRLCPNCRHYQRLKQRNPLKLWHRKCTCGGERSENGVYQNQTKHFHGSNHCLNEFETSYAPERLEIVYCEECYQGEVV